MRRKNTNRRRRRRRRRRRKRSRRRRRRRRRRRVLFPLQRPERRLTPYPKLQRPFLRLLIISAVMVTG